MNYSIRKGDDETTFEIDNDNQMTNLRGQNYSGGKAKQVEADYSGMDNTIMGDGGYCVYVGNFNGIIYTKRGRIIGIKEPSPDLSLNVIKRNSPEKLKNRQKRKGEETLVKKKKL